MRQLRPILAVIAIAALLVACSSTPSASSGDGGASSQPGASTGGGGAGDSVNGGGGGGGGGTGDTSHGSAKYHITGDYTADGELGFVPEASQFDNNGTWSLSFSNQANTVLVIILGEGIQSISYGDEGHTIGGAQCEFNITRQDADGAAGSFTCNDELLITSNNSTPGSADMSGDFEARK